MDPKIFPFEQRGRGWYNNPHRAVEAMTLTESAYCICECEGSAGLSARDPNGRSWEIDMQLCPNQGSVRCQRGRRSPPFS